MNLPPDLQRRLTESDQHLQAYLAVVPRRGADVVLHASARTAGELADRLEEIAGEIRERLPRDCISSAGYWYQAIVLPWEDYRFLEDAPAAPHPSPAATSDNPVVPIEGAAPEGRQV